MYARSAAVALFFLVMLLPPPVQASDSLSSRSIEEGVDDGQCDSSKGDAVDPTAIADLFEAGDPWGELLVTCAEALAKSDGAETGMPECDETALARELVLQSGGIVTMSVDPCASFLDPLNYPGLSPVALIAQYRLCKLSGDTDDSDCLHP